ncbi:MAG: ABC transporter ATP-binding protein [Oscillospiraceae bacterium]|jgi:simple sugar transport system ATP-binding protein|nr:ABC transporter ATP-binding protein [Oscillospiraceae bacterium]
MPSKIKISSQYAVQMRGVTKKFNNKKVLSSVDIDIKKGTVHAILGENGAGKSTLMNILYGFYRADEGTIFLNGKIAEIKSPHVAIRNKIGMVYQHFMLIDKFTVMENIILGNEMVNKFGVLDLKKSRNRILEISNKYSLLVDLDAKIEDMSVAMQQRVEILKILYREVDILIFDEPTAVLSPTEIEDFISTIRGFALEGKTVIVITHKLKEIMNSSDKCTIIRSGVNVGTVNISDVDQKELAEKMVGHTVELSAKKTKFTPGNVVFKITDLCVENEKKVLALDNFSLKVRAGEILGIAGVDGNGQRELIDSIACLAKVKSGVIEICGKQIQNTNPCNVLNNGIAIIHEDREKIGLILDYTVAENSMMKNYKLKDFSKNGILKKKFIDKFAKNLINKYDIKPENCINIPARNLSGGNQQKLVIAREISSKPNLLIAVQPTRGLDVGAIEYVHRMLIKERDEGRAIILISLEMDEIMQLSDTISVIYNGCIVGNFDRKMTNEREIGFLMAGGEKNDYNLKIS